MYAGSVTRMRRKIREKHKLISMAGDSVRAFIKMPATYIKIVAGHLSLDK